MNCDCVNEIEKSMTEGVKMRNGQKIIQAKIQGIFQLTGNVSFYSSSTLTLKMEGKKKQEKIEIKHTYCPFCGVKTEKEEAKAEPEK